jgi:hypothetical protein
LTGPGRVSNIAGRVAANRPLVAAVLDPGEGLVGTGAKVAIGCGIAFVVGGVMLAAVVFGGLWWAKGKAEQFTGRETQIEELKKKANAVPFTEPADGIVREDRLVKFLDIRRRVFDVYAKHKDELEAMNNMNKKKQADFGDVTRGLSVLGEVRLAQAQALADVGMSEGEYHFLIQQVYKTLWGSEAAKASPVPGVQTAPTLEVPPANIALFRKYETEIKQYAMGGLEWVGL